MIIYNQFIMELITYKIKKHISKTLEIKMRYKADAKTQFKTDIYIKE